MLPVLAELTRETSKMLREIRSKKSPFLRRNTGEKVGRSNPFFHKLRSRDSRKLADLK